VLVALCLLLGGICIGLAVHRDGTTTAATTPGTVSGGAVGAPVVVPSGTIPADEQDPAAAVAQALGPAVVQLDNGQGLGSGVIYDASGLILTNSHVVEDSTTLNVQFENGTSVKGQVLGHDPEADIAVVKVDAPNLTVARLSDGKVTVGQTAIAIGSPFGLPQTVTQGIISAVDRSVDGEQNSQGGATITINMIQTDAPINPGNSGGALADRTGAVIGINTSIFSESGDNNGIGFAIPIQTAKTVADKIVKGEPLDHAYLGVSTTTVDNGGVGAQIADVRPGSPADSAGLQVGDVVTQIDGDAVKNPPDLSARVVAHTPGDRVALVVQRGGATLTITVTLGTRASSSTTTPPTTR
jgi:putative serine protease PepD